MTAPRRWSPRIEAAGGRAAAFVADIGVVAECERLAREVIAAFGTVDILVNNAGVFMPKPIEAVTEEDWDAQLALNLKGAFFLTKAVVPSMKAKGTGKIINISSIAGTGGFPGLQRLLRVEGRAHEPVSGALPGARGRRHQRQHALARQHRHRYECDATRHGWLRFTAGGADSAGVGHMDPEQLTGAAVFLASADSDSVHGVDLLVDNGWAAW